MAVKYDPDKMKSLAAEIDEWAKHIENMPENDNVVKPGDFDAAYQLKDVIEERREEVETSSVNIKRACESIADGLRDVVKNYSTTEADNVTEVDKIVKSVDSKLPGFEEQVDESK